MNTLKAVSIDYNWKDRLQTFGKPPRPRGNLHNAIQALRYSPDWRGVLTLNEFTHKVHKSKPTPWHGPLGEWTDGDTRRAAAWFQANDIDVGVSVAADAVQTSAEDDTYNPVVEYLTNLEWDGIARVDSWLRDYLGVQWSDYSCAVGRAWLISACARAIQPGCKADHCLILEGPQGRGKSSALRALAGSEYFTDYISSDLSSKEAIMLCTGHWIVEFSELEGISTVRSKIETAKAFLSRAYDNYRPPYARHTITVPRTCIFAATTNHETYMPDESGNRRFWPVRCDRIDLNGIERDRDQIWAEAYKLYIEGQPYWLDKEMEAQARKEQHTRYDEDPWQEPIDKWLKDRTNTSVYEILTKLFAKAPSELAKRDQMRVARCLMSAGWRQFRKDNERRYYAPGHSRYKP